MYKMLIIGTLLVGTLALVGNLVPSPRRHAESRRLPGVVRAPAALFAALFGAEPARAATAADKPKHEPGKDTVRKTDEEWREQLTPEQYAVTRCSATERPFTGKYWDNHEKGIYYCVACGQPLFSSEAKYDSGSGWPSYFQPISSGAVTELKDISYGMVRTEVVCSRCEAHLGHVFRDGPRPTGLRYCINSAALKFVPADAKDPTAAQDTTDAEPPAKASGDDGR